MKIKDRSIVIINQAANYLTIGLANEFVKKFDNVVLITGSIHVQGEKLDTNVKIEPINKWKEEHGFRKALNYIRALCSLWYLLMTRYRKHEVFFVSVPPMAYLLNLIVSNKFSMLIWDVYPDVFKIAGMKETHPIYKIWSKLNYFSFKKSFKLFTIGEKMADLISEYVDRNKIIVQPIWSIFQSNKKVDKSQNPFIKKHNLKDKFIIQYSGNIGLTHKVETMLILAERMIENENILFQIIGRGARKKYLQKLVEEKQLKNCKFLPFQSDDMFHFSLSAADVGVVILDEKTSKGSVPSKSYNLMSYGIPSLYIASPDSELKNYAKKYNHAKCFSESELDNAKAFILKLYNESEYYNNLSKNSLMAAQNFKRKNANKIINLYLTN